MSALKQEMIEAFREVMPELVDAVTAKMKSEGGFQGEQWSRAQVIEYLKEHGRPGCDSGRITEYVRKGWLTTTPRSRGKKDFFYASEVKSLAKGKKDAA